MSENKVTVHFVRIPKELKEKEVVEAVGIGIYQIFSGQRPVNIPTGEEPVKTRINVSALAETYLDSLYQSNEFKSKNEILTLALAYIAEQPDWVRATNI